jgi:L-malate glycosyltransferase
VRVLYLNHTSSVGGAERSMLELVAALPASVTPMLACPRGPLADAATRIGVPVFHVRGTSGGLRSSSSRTLVTTAEIAWTGLVVRRLARRMAVDIVHANSMRAGLMALLGHIRGGPAAVIHVRDCLPTSRRTNLTRRLLAERASAIIANSSYTADRFQAGLSLPHPVRAIHNPIDVGRFDATQLSRAQARAALGWDRSAMVLVIVGQIAPWKAQADAIRVLRAIRPALPSARLAIVGHALFNGPTTRYDTVAYQRSLRQMVHDGGLGSAVEFLDERDDVPQIMRAADLLLVPSWEEPFGRVVVEAMAMETPVVATSVGGPAEIITDGVDGRLLPPRCPDLWARAVTELLKRPQLRREMGERGRLKALAGFRPDAHALAVSEVYRAVLA